jgi:mannose/fructose-specific phosphotransferase system component IIA
VANTSGVNLTMVVQVVCATSAGSSSSAASQGQGAHIVKQVMTKLKPAKG